ncbi:MAG: L,D-transpeptidase [Nitrospira sp.]|nr:L,D-transpeptidase [Nitrospira sp.]
MRLGRVNRTLTSALCVVCFSGCVQAVPPDLLAALESIDQDMIALRAPETAPEEYGAFVRQWIALKSRVELDDDVIRWPWETSELENELRGLYLRGERTVSQLHDRQADRQRTAQSKVGSIEDRFHLMRSHIGSIDGRIVLGERVVQTDLLVKQARTFFEQKDYRRAIQLAEEANQALVHQTALLTQELGRYADGKRIASWQAMAQQTVDWSRTHQSPAIVVSKAERELILYKNGRKVLSYPVRLGFNGIREKQFQGDGATPEGRYRVIDKRGPGQTQFYRALVLDYPNAEDRRRFDLAKKTGQIGLGKGIGGLIEIHGVENEYAQQTLGCVMLDNPSMAALFESVPVGTPITIVGALTGQNAVALALSELAHHNRQEI